MLPNSSSRVLDGRRILLLEDDYSQAHDAEQALRHAGASVLGPYADQRYALRNLADTSVSGAILDIYIDGTIEFALARELQRLNVPFLFLTYMNHAVVPADLAKARILSKPIDLGLLVMATRDLLRNRHLH